MTTINAQRSAAARKAARTRKKNMKKAMARAKKIGRGVKRFHKKAKAKRKAAAKKAARTRKRNKEKGSKGKKRTTSISTPRTKTKNWIYSVTYENWEVVKEKVIWGTKKERRTKKLQKNDTVIFYVKKTGLFKGAFKVVSDWYKSKKPIWADELRENKIIYPFQIKLETIQIGDARYNDLVPDLKFVKDKKYYTMYLQAHATGPSNFSRPIQKNDFKLIKNTMKKQPDLNYQDETQPTRGALPKKGLLDKIHGFIDTAKKEYGLTYGASHKEELLGRIHGFIDNVKEEYKRLEEEEVQKQDKKTKPAKLVPTHGTLPKEPDVKVTKEEPKDIDSKFSPWEISIKQKLSQSFNLREKFWKFDTAVGPYRPDFLLDGIKQGRKEVIIEAHQDFTKGDALLYAAFLREYYHLYFFILVVPDEQLEEWMEAEGTSQVFDRIYTEQNVDSCIKSIKKSRDEKSHTTMQLPATATCTNCGTEAKSQVEVKEIFGKYRKMKGKLYLQAQCKKCRSRY